MRGASTRPFTYTAAGQADSDNRAVGANCTFTYNAAGRLVQASRLGIPDAVYIHNALGERVVKALPGTPPPLPYATAHCSLGPGTEPRRQAETLGDPVLPRGAAVGDAGHARWRRLENGERAALADPDLDQVAVVGQPVGNFPFGKLGFEDFDDLRARQAVCADPYLCAHCAGGAERRAGEANEENELGPLAGATPRSEALPY